MISKIYSNLGFHRFGGAFARIGYGNSSGILVNDPTDSTQNAYRTYNTGFYNRVTENNEMEAFTYQGVPGTQGTLLFDSRTYGASLKSVYMRCDGATGYVRFNYSDTSIPSSGFAMTPNNNYDWAGMHITQIYGYTSSPSAVMHILGIPVDRV